MPSRKEDREELRETMREEKLELHLKRLKNIVWKHTMASIIVWETST